MLSLDEKDPIPFSAETPTIYTNINLLEPNLSIPQPHLSNADNDLDMMKNLRNKFKNNPGIGYLNINSLRGHKFHQLEQISEMCELDILCIDETKLTPEIPTAKFRLKGYQYPPIRRDGFCEKSNSFGGGKLVYIKEGLICKRLGDFETKTAETICIELALRNKKWFIMFGYRPESINRDIFFQEVNIAIDKAINRYKNILFIGDLNIDISIPNHDKKTPTRRSM